MKSLSIAGFLLMVGAMAWLLYSRALFSDSVPVIAAQGAAVGLMLWARWTFGTRSFHAAADPTEGGLVTGGPYRYVRHPIYTAICLFATAGVLANASPLPAIALAAIFAGAILRMLAEERFLLGKYPEYRRYSATTKRMVPFLF